MGVVVAVDHRPGIDRADTARGQRMRLAPLDRRVDDRRRGALAAACHLEMDCGLAPAGLALEGPEPEARAEAAGVEGQTGQCTVRAALALVLTRDIAVRPGQPEADQ